MRISRLFHIRKSRKYPIKRDEAGLSLRARCFELFDQNKRPAEAARELNMKETTAYRYFRDWKQLGRNFERQYMFVQNLFKKSAPDRDANVELFANALGIKNEQFETILLQPHGLRRFMKGKIYFPLNASFDHKLHVAMELAILISDHLQHGIKFVDVYYALGRYMQENAQYRKDQEADIEEYNKGMKIIHAVLAADMEKERQGRIKPDTLTVEERQAVIRLGVEAEKRKTELTYWFQIGVLEAQGLTMEEAREKMYQDLLAKGDLKGAKMLREFQDKIHPLGKNGAPSESPPQPPSVS